MSVEVRHLGGAVAREAPGALARLDAEYLFLGVGMPTGLADRANVEQQLERVLATAAGCTAGSEYLNSAITPVRPDNCCCPSCGFSSSVPRSPSVDSPTSTTSPTSRSARSCSSSRFSAMFAGLIVIQDRNFGILRELLVAPIRRRTIPLANVAAVLTVAMGQLLLIVTLSLIRGARLHVAAGRLALGLLAAALLSVATYALAELLAYRITQPQIFGTVIPAIGATPYALCGAIYPLATLPAGVKQFAYLLPWTHAVAVLRYGLMGASASGLHAIWHLHSNVAMASLSLGTLTAFAALTLGLALRAFERATLA